MASFLLDQSLWDLTVDVSGNIAVTTDPYATAQDVACALRLFSGELWYDSSQGLPYRQRVLGKPLSQQYLKAQFVATAKTVPTVATAKALITALKGRMLSGQVQVTLTSGAEATVSVAQGSPFTVTAISPVPD